MYNPMNKLHIKSLIKYWLNRHYTTYITPGCISTDTNLDPDPQVQVGYLWGKSAGASIRNDVKLTYSQYAMKFLLFRFHRNIAYWLANES